MNILLKVSIQCFIEGNIQNGRPRTIWLYNIIEWTKIDIGDLIKNTLKQKHV